MAKLWSRTESYEIVTEDYSGPLDLLLDLIQRAELDITKLSIASVTDQFLSYVQANQDRDPEYISEFLVISTKLIQIKSEAMLPQPPMRAPDEEDPGEALARQLKLYRQVKIATAWLNERLSKNLRSHLHVALNYPVKIQFDLSGLEMQDLILALENMVILNKPVPISSTISIPTLTIKQKVSEIISILRSEEMTSFHGLIGKEHTRLDMVVLFLAILELVKQRMVVTKQDELFSDIQIKGSEELADWGGSEITIEDL